MRKADQPDPPQPTEQGSTIQRLGHQIASFAGVLVVALVEFGVPLTPGQQSSILSIIVTGWAFASTIYGIRHRVANPTPQTPTQSRHRTTPRAKSEKTLPEDANVTGQLQPNEPPKSPNNL